MMDFLKLIFNEMDIIYYRQGTMIDEVEPSEFFTYWNISDTDEYADNVPSILLKEYRVYLYVHSTKLLENENYLSDTMNDFKQRARGYGLVVASVQDINSGLDNYLGKMCSVKFAQHE